MTDESKNEETLHIVISHFASSPKKESKYRKETKDESLTDKAMKISIERKSMMKSVINVNLNENESSGRETTENIQIKIEKNNLSNKKERKELVSPGRENYSKNPKKKVSSNTVSTVEVNNFKSVPGASGDRRDASGKTIKKGVKGYKVSFIDILTKNKTDLVHVIDVESFKAYNVDMSQDSDGRSGNCCGNGCNII